MSPETRRTLARLAEPGYQAFQQSLIPGVQNLLGVRLPALHRLAARLAAGDWRRELAEPDQCYEETLLRGLVIGRVSLSLPLAEALGLVEGYLPLIDNWCTCDTFCSCLKLARAQPEACFALAARAAASPQEYTARFGTVLLLRWWATPQALPAVLRVYRGVCCPAFYARMALAWGYAELAAVDFDAVRSAMDAAELDDFTYNKALQKMRESRRITPRQKELCQSCKRVKP